MLRITGILFQQFTGEVVTFAAMDDVLFLAAGRHRTLPMEGMAIGSDTAAAAAGLLITAGFAVQAAPGIDYSILHHTNPRSTEYVAWIPVS